MEQNQSPKKDDLFAEFAVPTYEEWYNEAVATLDGAPFEKKVMTPVYEGFDLKPLYAATDTADLAQVGSMPGFSPYLRGTDPAGYLARPWIIAQEVAEPSPEAFNQVLVSDLKKGQTGVTVACDPGVLLGLDVENPTGCGLAFSTADDLTAAFKDVDLAKTPVILDAGSVALPALSLFAAATKKSGADPARLSGLAGGDPLGFLAATGGLPLSLSAAYDAMAAGASWSAKNAPKLQTVLVSARPWHEAGASAVEELAFAAATGAEYLRALMDRGLSVDDAVGRFGFIFPLGRNMVLEIAKIRAARMVWDQVAGAFGASAESRKMRVHGRTSAYTKTVFDPFVNMLRNTIEAFCAAMGGVDSLHVTCFDETQRPSEEFSRRVSRNLQLVLQEECHFVRPVDPLGGSYAVEALTNTVAQKAWALFQEIEKQGGMAKALESGFCQNAVAAVAKKRSAALAKRKDVIIGTNMHPNLAEPPLAVKLPDLAAIAGERKKALSKAKTAKADLGKMDAGAVDRAVAAAADGATLGAIAQGCGFGAGSEKVQPLFIHRAAQSFEALRSAMDKRVAEGSGRAKIFLAGMGPLPQHKARADFSAGFFEVGGFEMIRQPGFSTEEEAAEAFAASDSKIAVICSTDKTYPEIVPKLAALLKAKKKDTFVILAGKPAKELEEGYRQAGMDDYIFMGADCLAMNANLQKMSGVTNE